jgi:hypothetical protein
MEVGRRSALALGDVAEVEGERAGIEDDLVLEVLGGVVGDDGRRVSIARVVETGCAFDA